MGTITAGTIISKAQVIAQDTTAIRWPVIEWVGWLNDAQREIAIIRPNSFTKIGNVTMTAGTKQSIPADGIQFLEFIRNMGAGGTIPGNAARKVDRRLMDSVTPDWHTSAKNSAVVQHYVFDPLSPKIFYVYPGSTGGTIAVEILYSASPTDLVTTGTEAAMRALTITLDDIYATVILDYLLYRAYSKDSEFVGNAERSLIYRKAFDNALGLKAQSDASSAAAAQISNKG